MLSISSLIRVPLTSNNLTVVRRSVLEEEGIQGQLIEKCTQTCPRENCDALCAKLIKVMAAAQSSAMRCALSCAMENKSRDECKVMCAAKATGLSSDEQLNAEALEELSGSCPNTKAGEACMARKIGVSESDIREARACVDSRCINEPDDQYLKCRYTCSLPLISAAVKKKGEAENEDKDDSDDEGEEFDEKKPSPSSSSVGKRTQPSSSSSQESATISSSKSTSSQASAAIFNYNRPATMLSVVAALTTCSLVLNLINV